MSLAYCDICGKLVSDAFLLHRCKPKPVVRPETYARRAVRIARDISIGQSISAVSRGRGFRAVQFRAKAGRLEVVDLHGEREEWLPVDLNLEGKPEIFDERGSRLV